MRSSEALHLYLVANIDKLLDEAEGVRENRPDSVHQVRVAARRTRSNLRVFRTLVKRSWADPIRTELGWLAGELGLARDTEVLIDRLKEHSAEIAPSNARLVASVIEDKMMPRYATALERGEAALGSERFSQLCELLDEARHRPRFTTRADGSANTVLAPLVHRAWKVLEEEADQLSLNTEATLWHEARISAKKARYAADAAIPAFGSPAEKLEDELSAITDLLGTHQDSHVAQVVLGELAEEASSLSTRDALLLLLRREEAHEMADREEFLQLWPKARHRIRAISLHQ